jgi:hypothetical protein
MVVRVKRNWRLAEDYSELTPGNSYRVISVGYGDYRLLADNGRVWVFPGEIFDVTSYVKADDWITHIDEKGL